MRSLQYKLPLQIVCLVWRCASGNAISVVAEFTADIARRPRGRYGYHRVFQRSLAIIIY